MSASTRPDTAPSRASARRPARGGLRSALAWQAFRLASLAARLCPPSGIERLLRPATALAVRPGLRPAWARAVAANQQVVEGRPMAPEALRRRVRAVLATRIRAQVEMLRLARRNARIGDLIAFGPEADDWLSSLAQSGSGALIVGPHLGNFDLMGRLMSRRIPGLMALVAPDEHPGYALENRARRNGGLTIVPVAPGALRQVFAHLRGGGIVVTGMDRPMPDAEVRPRFFGRPAPLPVAALRLAAGAGVPVAVFAAPRMPDGRYRVAMPGVFEVRSARGDRAAFRAAAEDVLRCIEAPIRAAPDQWTMFRPVWPAPAKETP